MRTVAGVLAEVEGLGLGVPGVWDILVGWLT